MSATTGEVPAIQTINQLVTMTFAPEHEEAFLGSAASVVAEVRANEPDTMVYMLTKDPERDRTYVWIETYRNQDALTVHSEAPHMADALAKLPGWWSTPPEVIQLRQLLSI